MICKFTCNQWYWFLLIFKLNVGLFFQFRWWNLKLQRNVLTNLIYIIYSSIYILNLKHYWTHFSLVAQELILIAFLWPKWFCNGTQIGLLLFKYFYHWYHCEKEHENLNASGDQAAKNWVCWLWAKIQFINNTRWYFVVIFYFLTKILLDIFNLAAFRSLLAACIALFYCWLLHILLLNHFGQVYFKSTKMLSTRIY